MSHSAIDAPLAEPSPETTPPPASPLVPGSARPRTLPRDPALDLVRVLGSFLIVMIHVCGALGFYRLDEPRWLAADFYDSTSRVSVPLFFMVSGAVLLGRDTRPGELVRRVWRIFIPLAAWSYIYFLWDHQTPFALRLWAGEMIAGKVTYHLWFCYSILGLYLFLPMLRAIAHHLEGKYLRLLLMLWALGGANTLAATLSNTLAHRDIRLGVDLNILGIYAGYMLLGHALYRTRPLERARLGLAVVGWIGASLAITAATAALSHRLNTPTETFFENAEPLVVLAAISSFLVLRHAIRFIRHPWLLASIAHLARASFGIYLCHAFILGLILYVLKPEMVAGGELWLILPLVGAGCFILSAALVAMIQAIPILRLTCPS